MKKLLLAAGVIGAMMLTASPAEAQRYHRGGTSFSISIGSGYAPYGGYYGYGYDPWAYDYAYPVAYYPYYPRYYSRYYYRRPHRHHRYYGYYRGW